jgi:ribonuclease HIII
MTLPYNIKDLSAVGSDEVGVGDYLAPLVVASAYVSDDMISTLIEIGVKDSKSMTDGKICEIAEQLKLLIPYKSVVLENKKYNAMVDAKINAHGIKSFLHNRALSELVGSLPNYPDFIIIDEFASRDLYFKYLRNLPKRPAILEQNLHFVKKGESVHVAVAAASILARAAFVEYMDALSEQLKMDILKGASAQVDKCAMEIVAKYGVDVLKDHCKWHFANTKRVVKTD